MKAATKFKSTLAQLISKISTNKHIVLPALLLSILSSAVAGGAVAFLTAEKTEQTHSAAEQDVQRLTRLYLANQQIFGEFMHLVEHQESNRNNLSVQFLELLKSSALDPTVEETLPLAMVQNYHQASEMSEPEQLAIVEPESTEPTCYALPEISEKAIRAASNEFESLGVEKVEFREKETVSLYAVTIEPKFARDPKNLARIEQTGLIGHYLITQDGPFRGHLSIGAFSQKDSAEKLTKKLTQAKVSGVSLKPKVKKTIKTAVLTVPENRAKEFERFSRNSLKIKPQRCENDAQV